MNTIRFPAWKKTALTFVCLIVALTSFGQTSTDGLTLVSDYSSENEEIADILQFEGIDYLKLKFAGEDLRNKSYTITVKEIWDGQVTRTSTVFDSKTIGIAQFEKVNGPTLDFKVLSKLTPENRIKISFKFPRFSITKEYEAIDSKEYSLRNIAEESELEIGYGKEFYLLAYILPYERPDGSKSWCEVGTSGKDIENWGARFGIKHYLLFEMKFE